MGIICPILIITDREIVLIKALDYIFPESTHLLCIWYININILANYRKYFLKDLPGPIVRAPNIVNPK
jgi:hypothetical protein